jgi:crotonobetainyl-CoA:carnitine CoA-transferase CaiB-like acyl-CoA transferase
MKRSTIFKNLKVVELASVLAGPAVGTFFAELGATVVKVENKATQGDITRTWKIPQEDATSNTSAYYAAVNWGKKSIMVDLQNAKDKLKVMAMVKLADIVITNYKYGDAEKFGMDYYSIKQQNPKVIYASINGFGIKSKRIAYDIVLQAETGFMYMNGTPKVSPIKMPVALIDIIAAHQLKEGILVALVNRMQTGKGAEVTVSLYDAAIASLANQASAWLNVGVNPQPIGTLHPNIAPYGECFFTSDKKLLVLAVASNKQFEALCKILSIEKLLTKKDFCTNKNRVENRKKLAKHLAKALLLQNAQTLMTQFEKQGVPAGIVKSVQNVLEEKEAKKLIVKHQASKIQSVRTSIFKIN